jgi:predicted Zn-ribbon and HTH transcriptional regulator
MTGDQGQAPRTEAAQTETAQTETAQTEMAQTSAVRADVAALAEFAAERPGDPACLLPRVCQACGAVADTAPPTVCPQCGAEMPVI